MAGDPQPDTVSFGELLRRRRIAANLTQEALAERAGLSARGISDLERGARTHPYRETLAMLSEALGLSGPERAALLQAATRPARPSVAGHGRDRPLRLPEPLNRIIGRDQEVATVRALLGEEPVRLVTLTGTGGVGKTRLAVAAAAMSGGFADGAVFVDLASLRDANRVPERMAASLDIEAQGAMSMLDAVRRHLEPRRLLLVLDNFEHLLAAAPIVGDLLRACGGVKALVTSREPLRLRGEREFAVRALAVPGPGGAVSDDELAESAAVRLFVERAREASADFALAPDQVATVAAICRRLDGLPLAIELAAPRVKVLPLRALLARLEQRLPALSSAPRDAPARQRTMRDAIAWSYDLLTPEEQTLFRRLSVFGGGWTLEAAETVGGRRSEDGGTTDHLCSDLRLPTSDSVLDLLASLIDKGLVQRSGDEMAPRFAMLATIRDFAEEALRGDAAELDAVQRAHARVFGMLAREAYAGLMGTEQMAWLERLDAEDANLTAALAWTIAHDTAAAGLAFAGALWRYWATRGRLGEGRDWLERALARPGAVEADDAMRGDAHNALGNLLGDMGEYEAARRHYEAALALRQPLGDAEGVAGVLNNLGLIAAWLGEYERASALHEESLDLRRALGDPSGEALSLTNLGDVMSAVGDFDRAGAFHQESLRLREAAHDTAGIAYAHYNLGELARLRHDDTGAERHLHESARRFDALGDRLGIAYASWSLGALASRQGDRQRAAALFGSALDTRLAMGDRRGVVECLEGIGVMALRDDTDLAGARLLGAARRQREILSCPLPPSLADEHEEGLKPARQRHGAAAVDALLADPGLHTMEDAVQAARATLAGAGGPARRQPGG